jgi:uncharacterized RDD family membrane protein YckC
MFFRDGRMEATGQNMQIDLGHWLLRLIAFIIDSVILSVLYFLVLEVSWGGTIGKRILGLQVQTVKGGRTAYSQSFIRNISKIFWVFLLLDWLIGVLTPGDKRQKYSDRMAGTIVVQASQSFASITPPPQTPSQ